MQPEMLEIVQDIRSKFSPSGPGHDKKTGDSAASIERLVSEICWYSDHAKLAISQNKKLYSNWNRRVDPDQDLEIDAEDIRDIAYAVVSYRDFLSPLGKAGEIIRNLVPGVGPMEGYLRDIRTRYNAALKSLKDDNGEGSLDTGLLLSDAGIVGKPLDGSSKDKILGLAAGYLVRSFTLKELADAHYDIELWYHRVVYGDVFVNNEEGTFWKKEDVCFNPWLNLGQISRISGILKCQSLADDYRFRLSGIACMVMDNAPDPADILAKSEKRLHEEYAERGVSAIRDMARNMEFLGQN
jgi:hypothetical protein